MLVRRLLGLVLVLLATRAPAQTAYRPLAGIDDESAPHIVAGYRAIFTCSAHFVAGRALEDIERVELADTQRFGFPSPQIDEVRRLVHSRDADATLERIAVFRPGMGCSLLPPEWGVADADRLPFVRHDPVRRPAVLFPAGDTVHLPPAGVDVSYPALSGVMERAFDGRSFAAKAGTLTTAVLVVHRGRLVAERYRPGFGPASGYRTWSTSKSITAALIGIAAGEGLIDLDAPLEFAQWSGPGDPRRAITGRHLLWMSSGLFSGGSNSAGVYFGGQDVASAATGGGLEARPGTRWKYANNDTLLLALALHRALADDARYLRYPYDRLLHRIGMYDTTMEVDHAGDFVASSQTYTTARDLARFGLLLLGDGMWQGQRILPQGWVRFLATPAPTKPPTDGQWGYGAQFWLLDRMPGVPAGTFSTAGRKGQYVTVVPGHDLVIVRTGVDPEGSDFAAHQLVADVVRAVQD
ncbi:MAG: beta-lactamase family protein [Burkholderiales bacterium]|nr:beta-lactamase family protein [Burkholderiales bacterium]